MAKRGLVAGSAIAIAAGKKSARTKLKNARDARREARELRKSNEIPKRNENGLKIRITSFEKKKKKKIPTNQPYTLLPNGLKLFRIQLSNGQKVVVLSANKNRKKMKESYIKFLYGPCGDIICTDNSLKNVYVQGGNYTEVTIN